VRKNSRHVKMEGPPTPEQVRKWTALELWEAAFLRSPERQVVEAFPDLVAVCLWCAHCWHRLPVEHECMRLPTKEDRSKAASPSGTALTAGQLLSPFSNVFEYLTTMSLPGGKQRKAPRLSLKCTGSGLRLTVNDDESCQYATWEGSCLDDLFLMFEEALATDQVPWRASADDFGKRRK
jgi:hypothetical protein